MWPTHALIAVFLSLHLAVVLVAPVICLSFFPGVCRKGSRFRWRLWRWAGKAFWCPANEAFRCVISSLACVFGYLDSERHLRKDHRTPLTCTDHHRQTCARWGRLAHLISARHIGLSGQCATTDLTYLALQISARGIFSLVSVGTYPRVIHSICTASKSVGTGRVREMRLFVG